MRRVRVAERRAAALASTFGVLAACSSASPTGGAATDVVIVFIAVSTVAWLAASAPWWALATAGGAAFLAGFAPLPIALGVVATGTAFAIGTARADVSLARVLSGGCSALAFCHLQLSGFSGCTALIGLGGSALLVGTGLARRKRRVRVWVRRVAIGSAVFAAITTAAAGAAAAGARSDFVEGREHFEAGVASLRSGDPIASSVDFAHAEEAFAAADRAINRPWAQPARLVPIVGIHRHAAAVAATAGKDASADIARLAAVLDVDRLRPVAGRFDLDSIALLSEPFADAYRTLLAIGDELDAAQSPWLISTVQQELRSAAAEFDANIGTFETLNTAVHRVPTLLGQDGPRRYFVAFTTPAEARGTGGFMGNFALLTADRGRVTMTEFGRTRDLNRGFSDRTVDAPAEWLRKWGRYGFNSGPDGTTSSDPWSSITISPHFPSTAAAIASLFPQSGGTEVDGVIAMDPYVLQALVGFSEPVEIDRPGVERTQLTQHNTAQFLLFDQYAIDTDDRIDALEAVATETLADLLGGSLPDPAVLSDQLGGLIDEERLVAWMADSDDQALINSIGMSGGLPLLDGNDDGFSVVVNNAGANKLDAFLTRGFAYEAVYSAVGAAGADTAPETTVDGQLSITLTSSAPTSGLDDGVIGNYVGDPVGTNRSLITVYTAAAVSTVTVNGTDAPFERGTEASWNLSTFVVTTPAGGSTDIVVQVSGSLLDNDGTSRTEAAPTSTADDDDGVVESHSLVVRTQPLVDTPTYEIMTRNGDGRSLLDHFGEVPGTLRWATP